MNIQWVKQHELCLLPCCATCPMKMKATPNTASTPATANLAVVTNVPIVADAMMVQVESLVGDAQVVIADAGNAKANTAGGESCSVMRWVIDSGCLEHMDRSTENFISYSEYKEPRFVHLANRALVPALGISTVTQQVVVYQYDKPFGYGCWMTSITTMNHILIFLGYSEFPRWLPWQPIQISQYPKIIQQSIPI